MVGNLAWYAAMWKATDKRDLSGIAALLRKEEFQLSMLERRALAELLSPQNEGAKVEARVMPRKVGRESNRMRDHELYVVVMSYKLQRGLKKMPNAVLLEIGAQYGLRTTDTINTALKNGKRVAAEMDSDEE